MTKTRSEIKQALTYCASSDYVCHKCPYAGWKEKCGEVMPQDVLEYILELENELKAVASAG